MNKDTFTVEILPDGTLKLETDKVSDANHMGAESFLKEVCRMAGGNADTKHKHGHTHHGHTHSQGEKAHHHS